jgi:hypothetical protein
METATATETASNNKNADANADNGALTTATRTTLQGCALRW